MELKKVMAERRAVNFFDATKPVSDEDLRKIIETAALAPSGFNLQPWQLLVVKSPADKERLKEVASKQPKIAQAPVVLIVLGDRDGWKAGHPVFEKAWQNMVDLGYNKPEQKEMIADGIRSLHEGPERSLAFAAKNAAFFGMSIMLAAKDAGYDSHPMDGFDHEGVRKAFEIPDNYFVPMLIAIGHFDQKRKLMPPKWRKSYDEIVLKTY